MLTSPIIIKQTDLYATPKQARQTLNELLNAWLPFKNTFLINDVVFSNLYDAYELHKPNAYFDTRLKRFQTLIEQEVLAKLLNQTQAPSHNKKLVTALCQWLIKHATMDNWQQTLSHRLNTRGFLLEGNYDYERFITLNEGNQLTLVNRFCFYSNHHNQAMLFSGESLHTLTQHNEALIEKRTQASASLFDASMENAFRQETLDEKINAYVLSPSQPLHDEEIEILHAARDYYLQRVTAETLKQRFISTNNYSAEFKQSVGYELIKTILNEHPMDGFSLK